MMAFNGPSWYAGRTRTICIVLMVVSPKDCSAILTGGRAIGFDGFVHGRGGVL